jgi:asparagine synthetase B (glutamine-hydrolysing)
MIPIVNFNYTTDPFDIQIKPVIRSLLSWKDEVFKTVETIVASTKRPIVIALSGGIDGEAIALAMLEKKIPFSALTVRHKEGTNDHDIKYAQEFCQLYNIKQQIVEISILDFINHGVEKYIDQGYRANNVYRYFQLFLMELAESQEACVLIGSGEQVYYNYNQTVCLRYPEELLTPIKWCQDNNTLHYPFFHMTNSELVASYMQIPCIKKCLENNATNFLEPSPLGNPNNSGPEKIEAYHQVWPVMTRRPKYHGYENVHEIRKLKQAELIKRFSKQQVIYIPIKTARSQLGI